MPTLEITIPSAAETEHKHPLQQVFQIPLPRLFAYRHGRDPKFLENYSLNSSIMSGLGRIDVTFSLENIHCYDEADGPGRAEPYLWAVFFKVDGDTVVFDIREGKLVTKFQLPFSPVTQINVPPQPTMHRTNSMQGDLGTSMTDGDNVGIVKSLGTWSTVLKPIPFSERIGALRDVGGVIGCVVVLMEQDETKAGDINAGYQALVTALRDKLVVLLSQISIISQKIKDEDIDRAISEIGDTVKAAIRSQVSAWEFLSSFGDMDEQIGSTVFRYDHKDMEPRDQFETVVRSFSKRWDNEGAWEISNKITARRSGPIFG